VANVLPPPTPPPNRWLCCVQAASVVAAWPLLRPLVKYRNIATRAAITIAMLAVIRSGLYIALPGVDLAAVPAALPAREGARRTLCAPGRLWLGQEKEWSSRP